jgi:raffinose/stachyose/melibiose transport system substrate-binding protein
MKHFKPAKIAAVTLAFALVLTGCSSGSTSSGSSAANSAANNAKTELTISHFYLEEQRSTDVPADLFLTLTDAWQKKNPNVKLTQTPMTQADYATKIQAQAAVNELPDIFFLKGSWTGNFANSNLMLPLNTEIDSYKDKDKFRAGVFDAATSGGKIYGMPNQLTVSSVVYYNSAMWASVGYDKFPDTWKGILDGAAKLNAKNVAPIALGNKDNWPAESTILSNLGDRFTGTDWTNSIIANDGKAKFTDPLFVSSLKQLQTLSKAKVFNADYNTISNTQAEELYCQGRAATTIDGHWALNYIQTNATKDVLSNTKVALLPPATDGKGDPNTLSGGCGWYVALNSNLKGEKLKAALDFLFATSGYDLSVMTTEKYGLSGACVVANADMSKLPQLTKDYNKLTSSVKLTPVYDLRMDGAVIDVMNTGLQEFLNGTKTPEELAKQIQTEQDNVKKS